MIINNIKLRNICVLSKTLSISMSVDGIHSDITDELKAVKGKKRHFVLYHEVEGNNAEPMDTVSIESVVQSYSVSNSISFTLHTDLNKVIAMKLYDYKTSGKPLSLSFQSLLEKELESLLTRASKRKRVAPDKMLQEITTFHEDGKPYSGKTNIADLSEKHKTVAIDKLKQLLAEPLLKTI